MHDIPEWFKASERCSSEIMGSIAAAATAAQETLPLQVKWAPMKAHWFLLDSLLLANRANRDGMHANAISLTRQCIEAMTIVEIGISGHADAGIMLERWDRDECKQGQLRSWLQANLWERYGTGLWDEPWYQFMGQLARAVQNYSHYTGPLSQWQDQLIAGKGTQENERLIRIAPRAYDQQKATRITLLHAILIYSLGRIFLATRGDAMLGDSVFPLGKALSASKYLDGAQTEWSQQFWSFLWTEDGDTTLE